MLRTLLFVVIVLISGVSWAQHDPGRDAVRFIARGQIAKARDTVAAPAKSSHSPIGDAQRHFVLAIAASRLGDSNAAITHLRKAVSLGLPIERVVAGPRDLFEPLQADAEFKTWLDSQKPALLHGPMLTSVTDTSAQFWVRTAEPGRVQARVKTAAADDSSSVKSNVVRSNGQRDFTAVVMVTDLSPATEYQYQILVDGVPIGQPASMTTFPAQGSPARVTIGLGGGAGYTPQFHSMWKTILEAKPVAFLMLGDNVYIDDPKHPLTQHYCYYRRQSEPNWKSLTASTCIYSIYDDHDFGENDCVPGPEVDHPIWKRPVWEVFRQNWNNPGYGGGREQPGCWYDFTIGDVHFIMLDGRYYRDLTGGTMLGGVQKQWLFETLRASEGRFKFLVSPVPWSPGVKPRSRDTWDGYTEEREEIFSFIHRHKIDGVMLLAADRHRSDVRRIPREDGYDFYEFMSSRLTNVHTHGLVEDAKGSEFLVGYNEKCSFGRVTWDTTLDDPTIECAIVNIDGEVVAVQKLALSQLSDQ